MAEQNSVISPAMAPVPQSMVNSFQPSPEQGKNVWPQFQKHFKGVKLVDGVTVKESYLSWKASPVGVAYAVNNPTAKQKKATQSAGTAAAQVPVFQYVAPSSIETPSNPFPIPTNYYASAAAAAVPFPFSPAPPVFGTPWMTTSAAAATPTATPQLIAQPSPTVVLPPLPPALQVASPLLTKKPRKPHPWNEYITAHMRDPDIMALLPKERMTALSAKMKAEKTASAAAAATAPVVTADSAPAAST